MALWITYCLDIVTKGNQSGVLMDLTIDLKIDGTEGKGLASPNPAAFYRGRSTYQILPDHSHRGPGPLEPSKRRRPLPTAGEREALTARMSNHMSSPPAFVRSPVDVHDCLRYPLARSTFCCKFNANLLVLNGH